MQVNPVYRIVHALTRLFFKIYGRWEIIHYRKLPRTGAVIAACNHVSYLDPMMVGSAITRECAFMARQDLWRRRWLGWLLEKLGSFRVDRGRPDRGAIRKSLDALRRGLCLVIFPEGGRSPDGKLQRAEAGVALIVQKSGAPVVPIAVIGSEIMLPAGQKRLKRTRLAVVFGDAIYFTPDSPRQEILGAVMRAIAELLSAHGRPSVALEDSAEQPEPVSAAAEGTRQAAPLPARAPD
jgi:1-acyl-sn-glycerol-3-phosphate acyltransferase